MATTLTSNLKQQRSIGTIIKDNWKDLVYAFRDLKTQKTRTFFGIGGIVISIFLMQVVGVVTDSLSYSFLDSSATTSGSADFIITRRLDAGSTLNIFMNQTHVQGLLDGVEEIESVFPRLLLLPIADVVNPGPGDRQNRTVTFYGLDVTGEHDGGLGRFRHASNGSLFTTPIPDGYCILTPFMAETLHVGIGDQVTVRYATFPAVSLTVMAIVNQEQKFTIIEVDTIVTNLEWVQSQYLLEGKVNYFQALIKNREYVYDTRNIPGTIHRMRVIGEKIQETLGYDYQINMLKLQDLEQSEMMNIAMSVAFVFISIISMLISAILINSILSTAVEERIREFGVFRVLGARRGFSFKLIVYQGFVLSTFGSAAGIVLGTAFAQVALPVLYDWLGMWTNPIALIVQPATIATSFITGVGITFAVTSMPAMRAARTKIVHAINPYRHKDTGWVVKKEGRVNTKLISGGLAAVAAGSLVFFLIPQIVLTGQIYVVFVAFLGVQLAFLLGLTLMSLGFVPGLEWIVWRIFHIFNKKTTPIVRTSIYRYQRRNTSTVLMFSMTFAFILFISTTLELMKVSQRYQIMVNYGAPMVLYSNDVRNQVDEQLAAQVASLDGVAGVSCAFTDALDIAALQLQLSQTGAGDLDFGRLFGSDRYSAVIADMIGYYSFSAALVGIDEQYPDIMPEELMEVTGGKATVMKLFEDAPNIIIAKSVADSGKLGIGDRTRLTFYNGSSIARIVNASIVGISDGMPGFWQFREARLTAFYGGVMTSRANYLSWMDLNETNAPVSKIYIDVTDSSVEAMNGLRNEIDRTFQSLQKADGSRYDFVVEHAQARIDMILESLSTVQLLFLTILSFTILIALFGLMSSVYSTVLERKREIGVLKAVGLKNRQTRNLFMMESVIILLASSTGGSLIGILSSIINTYQQTVLTEVPIAVITNIANLPWGTIFTSFGIALSACLVGMTLLLRRIETMEIMEIFRDTM